MRNKIMLLVISALVLFIPICGYADSSISNDDLKRAMQELEAAKVYIQEAQEHASSNTRVIFHYEWLMNDINEVENGIQQKFMMPHIQPRTIKPLSGDYIDIVEGHHKNNNKLSG